MQFFRITRTDRSQKEIEAESMEAVLYSVDSETTDSIERLDPDSDAIFGEIHKDGRIWLNPATKELRLTNCDVTLQIPIEHYGLISRFEWFVTEERDIITMIDGNLVEMNELVENPWLAG